MQQGLSFQAMRRFICDERAATAVEYALVAGGIAVAIAATIMSLGVTVEGLYIRVANAFN